MKNIAFIGTKGMNFPGYSFGGFETVITELAPRLAKHGFDITIYCRKNLYPSNISLPKVYNNVNLKYISSIESKNLGTLSNSFLSIISAIKSKTKIIFLFNIGLGIYIPIIKFFGIKVVTNLDGVEWKRSKWSSLAKMVFMLGAWVNSKFADVLIADAEGIREIYKIKFNVESTVIPYGAEIKDKYKISLISQYNLNKFGYYLLATRFIPENNPLFIIENFSKINLDKPLVVLGRNYYNSEYENKIKDFASNKIIFLDHINDRETLLNLYHYSYVYIHGHSVGGTNPTMLEALANGSCILAHNNPFNREMLEDGTFGDFFELNEEDFIDKINYLEKNEGYVKDMKSKTPMRVKNYYNWDIVEQKYLDLLNSL